MNTFPRRTFLAVSATAITMSAIAALQASVPAHGTSKVTLPRTLVLYRESHALSRQFALLGRQAGLPAQALTDDPVRQWRDGPGALMTQEGWRLAGISNWIDFMLVRGLAAEARRLPLLVLQHSEAQLQQQGIEATAAALLDFLHVVQVAKVAHVAPAAQKASAENIIHQHALLIGRSLNINNRPDLFSWVI